MNKNLKKDGVNISVGSERFFVVSHHRDRMKSLRELCTWNHPGMTNSFSASLWDFVDCLLWTAADVVRKSKHKSPEELHHH
jgi:hypothetical protein